jgi:hypothetical protein
LTIVAGTAAVLPAINGRAGESPKMPITKGFDAERPLNAETTRDMMTRGKLNIGATFDYGMGLFLKTLDEHQVMREGGGVLDCP